MNKIMTKRLKAYTIDFFIANGISVFIFFITMGHSNEKMLHFDMLNKQEVNLFTMLINSFISVIIVANLPILLKDINSQSIGKSYYGLKIVNTDGSRPNTFQLIARNITIFFSIDLVFLALNKKRLGDIICKTEVIETEEQTNTPSLLKQIILITIITFCANFFFQLLFSGKHFFNKNSIVKIEKEDNPSIEQEIMSVQSKYIDSCDVKIADISFNSTQQYVSVLIFMKSENYEVLNGKKFENFYANTKNAINLRLEGNKKRFVRVQYYLDQPIGYKYRPRNYIYPE